MDPVRTRFAPSPSGFLHIGSSKTSMYNWILARQTGGVFVMRMEDTDAERTDEAYVQGMCEGFQWLGIDWDEGPEFGGQPEKGDYAPYRQSQRRDLHCAAAAKLVEEGTAYKCFCTKDELAAFREAGKKVRETGKWRDASPEDVAAMGDASYVIRFKVPEGKTVLEDLIQGTVVFDNKEFDDFVIVKPNGDPIFHLAVVVDDATMKITHVVRGDDHLTNTPRHIMLFNALGYPLPKFAHHPLVHDEQGRKFSKRLHGANVLDWREDGYLPEAVINYVALLGWTSEEENKEFFTLDELIKEFTLERLSKSAAKFDRNKLSWINGLHIRNLSIDGLLERVTPILEKEGFDLSGKSPEWLAEMATITQEKLTTLNDIVAQTDYFFQDVTEYNEKAQKKQFKKENSVAWLETAVKAMESASSWDRVALHGAYEATAEAADFKLGKLVGPTRLALTGKAAGPGLFELAELLGKETCLKRMADAIAYVQGLD